MQMVRAKRDLKNGHVNKDDVCIIDAIDIDEAFGKGKLGIYFVNIVTGQMVFMVYDAIVNILIDWEILDKLEGRYAVLKSAD